MRCECWIPVVTLVVTSVVTSAVTHALLLLALYIMLSRKIAQHSRGMQASSSPAEHPSPQPRPAPALSPSPGGDKAQPAGAQKPAPDYSGSSDTSSDTSDDSADSPRCPQGPGLEENLNYASLVFPGKDLEAGSAQDYENMKTGMDYVNVDPKKKKMHFWPFSSPRSSRAVEYTEVKL